MARKRVADALSARTTCQDRTMRLKVLLPDGSVKKFPIDHKRVVTDGVLAINDATGKQVASFPKGNWTAVGRMRVATESSDDDS